MTTYHGNSGVIKQSTHAIAEVKKFEITETAPVTQDSSMGDAWETHLAGAPKSWSGSIDANYFPADTNGQAMLTIGASVTLELDAIGVGSGLENLSGTATITSRQVTTDMTNVVSVTFQFTGNGVLTHGAQS